MARSFTASFNFFAGDDALSFNFCVNDAQPVDNSVFCSGCSVIVLVTEHVFLFRIKDLHACSDVPVILGV